MIRVSGIRVPVTAGVDALPARICRALGIRKTQLLDYTILRRSIDARDRAELRYAYTVAAKVEGERRVLSSGRKRQITPYREVHYRFPDTPPCRIRPVIVGAGPAGLFCAYELALHGHRPLLLERGDDAQTRRAMVDAFWEGGELDPESNVQFGEGGAGTFSDGKLATGIRDAEGRIREVLEVLVACGAPEEILYDARPHLGTDLLVGILQEMRRAIQDAGGEIRFRSRVTELLVRGGKIQGLRTHGGVEFDAEQVVLATGHSARDVFSMLRQSGVPMEAKNFAVGVRIEHPQEWINRAQYGPDAPDVLGAAEYKLTHRTESGRGVYSFCMCPGGYVVNASSDPEHLAVNGMSYSGRAGSCANSAIVATVSARDLEPYVSSASPAEFAGIRFQEKLERAARLAGGGKIPAQRFAHFLDSSSGDALELVPQTKGAWVAGDVRGIFPADLAGDLAESVCFFGSRIQGFDSPDALLFGVESRTSSPVRILRGNNLQSAIAGLYPCGEGAGYAGGIVSAAVDGIRVAEKIASTSEM